MLGHPARNRAEPLGFSGKPDVGEPFEQDPNRDLTIEATDPTKPDRMERLDLGADRDDTVDRRHGPSARRPSPAQSKTDGSTGTVGLDWPRPFRAEAMRSARSRARPLGNPWTVDCRKPLRCVADVLPDGR